MAYHKALQTISDPTRRSVLESLRSGPQAVGEIAKKLPVSRPAVSQHALVLRVDGDRAGLDDEDGVARLVLPEEDVACRLPPRFPRFARRLRCGPRTAWQREASSRRPSARRSDTVSVARSPD